MSAAANRPVLEAATVIRVPPPGRAPDYVVAAVRVDGRLHAARLRADPDELPAPGSPLEAVGSELGVPVYRVTAA